MWERDFYCVLSTYLCFRSSLGKPLPPLSAFKAKDLNQKEEEIRAHELRNELKLRQTAAERGIGNKS